MECLFIQGNNVNSCFNIYRWGTNDASIKSIKVYEIAFFINTVRKIQGNLQNLELTHQLYSKQGVCEIP